MSEKLTLLTKASLFLFNSNRAKRSLLLSVLLTGLFFIRPLSTSATVSITAPSLAISTCTYSSGYSALGNIVIDEGANGDIPTGTGVNQVFTVPAGFEFLASTGSVTFTAGNNLSAVSISVTTTTITLTYTCGNTNKGDQITISGIHVRAITGPTASSNITRTSGGAVILGLSTGTSIGTLSSSTLVAPAVSAHPAAASICPGANTSFSITATGGGLTYQWQQDPNTGTFANVSNGGIFSGATTATLTLTAVPFANNNYKYRCVVSGTCSPSATSNSATLTVNAISTSAAGVDQTVCVSTATLAGNAPSTGTGAWTVTAGTATVTSPTSPTSGVTGLVAGGSATLRWTITNGACTSTDDVIISYTGAPSSAPVAAAASTITNTSFSANWAAVTGASGYFLDVCTDAGFTSFVSGYNNLNVGNVTTYSVTGLTSATTYYYRLRAYNVCGTNLTNSNSINLTTTSTPNLVPFSGNTTITTCGGTVQDGGGSANYSNSANGYMIINPSLAGNMIMLTFTQFALETCCDYVTIFNGAGTGGTVLFNGNGLTMPPVITSTAGPLTIRFTSDGSVVDAGFTATITCIAPCTGTPTAGTAVASVTSITACASPSTTLSLTGTTVAGGLTYQWQSAPAAAGPWTNIAFATTATYSTGVYGNTYFRCIVTCTGSGASSTSSSVLVSSTISGPANDNCATATALTMNVYGSCASTSPGDVACASASGTTIGSCFGDPNDDIWYSFVATASTHYITLATTSGFDAYQQLYSGTCGALTSIQCSDPNAFTATGLTAGQTYYLRVYSYSSAAPANGNLTVCVSAPPVCPGALGSGNVNIAALPYNATAQTTCGAGDDLTTTNTATCGSSIYLSDEDKVYIFTPGTTGQITVTLNSTQSSTGATLYAGCPFSGTCVNYVQSASSGSKSFCATVTAGVTYYLVIDSYNTTGSCITSFTVDITAPSGIPAGTICATAPVVALPYAATGHTTACYDNDYTSASTGSCGTSYESGEDRVYAFTTSGAECIGITLSNSNTSSIGYQIYSGCPGTSGPTCIGSAGGATSGTLSGNVTVPGAGTYYLIVDTWSSPSTANYDIAIVSFGSGPVNDLPCNATLMTLGVTETGDNTCSGGASEPATPSCWTIGNNNSVWYKVVPTGTTLKIKTSLATLSNTHIQVYSGTCGSLTALATGCNDNSTACGSTTDYSSYLSLTGLTAGTTYYIRVDGYSNLVGTFGIIAIDGASTFPPIAGQDCSLGNPVCNSTMSISNPGYQGIGATCDIPSSYCLASAERGSAWYTFTTNAAGAINFDIVPNDWVGSPSTTSTDYDFALWKVTGSVSCATILAGTATPVRCNYSGLGVTGLSPTGNAPAAYPGFDLSYEAEVACASGDTWILLINNHSTSTQGFTINFATGGSGAAPIAYTPSPTSITWSGGTSTAWNLASNWGGCAVPVCGIDAVVNTFTNQPNITAAMGAQYVKDLTINLGATLTLSAGSVLHICGNLVNNGTITASPTSTIIFDNASTTQTMTGNFTGASKLGHLTITKTGGSVMTNDDVEMGGNFTTSSSTSVFNSNGKYIKVAGNFVNAAGNSTFTSTGTTGTLEFKGTAAQTYNQGSSQLDLNAVLMNHTGTGVNLLTDMNIKASTGTLTLTLGKINTTVAYKVIVSNSAPAAVSTGNTSSYVNGFLRRYIDNSTGSFDFPVGTSSAYQRANINFTLAPVITYLTADFQVYSALPGPLGSTECSVTYNMNALDNGFWNIEANTANNNTGKYDMTLYNTSYSNAAGGWTVMSRHNGSATWALVNGDGTMGACVAGAVTAVERDNMVGFSKFGTAQAAIPLPIELLSFSGKNEGLKNKLEWSTATESNNDFFTLEHSPDGYSFESFDTRDGAGNSTAITHYAAYDYAPYTGKTYYRLKQTDFDGKYSYSSIVVLENRLDQIAVSNVHPNPTMSDLYFDFYSPVSGTLKIQVLDFTGRMVAEQLQHVDQGKTELSTQLSDLAKGIYTLKVEFSEGNYKSITKVVKY